MELHRSARVTRVHESDAIAVAGGCTSRSVARSVCALSASTRTSRQIGHEVADDMPGAILEARVVRVTAQAPTENSLIEDR